MANQSQAQRREVAWIAGVGASAGLGAAVARRFAREGLTVAVSGRTPAKLEAVVEEIRKAGGLAFALPADVSREEDIVAAAGKVSNEGQLRVAVFNASGFDRTPSLELTSAVFESAWRTTTLGGFVFAREATRTFVSQGRGTLLITGATGSLRGKPPFAAFAAAKAGLRSVAQTFAREFGPRGVHVAHIVIDGAIEGERVLSVAPQLKQAAGEDGLLGLDAIADVYWHLHAQHRSAWTHELDLRPFKESF
jgi:NAD(P)-dependent dehydrogenase (short-subunit alcohol dehydrogenase family)